MSRYVISDDAARAFLAGKNWKRSNTEVIANKYGVYLRLFSNLIAKTEGGTTSICFQGWRTQTTCDRLEALTGYKFSRRGGFLSCNGKYIDSCKWYTLDELRRIVNE